MKKGVQSFGGLSSVAELAGVSKATASRVLNNVGSAAQETRQRILAAAHEVNYVPNAQFRQLRQRTANGRRGTGNIGLLLRVRSVDEFALDPYYSRLFWGIEHEAQNQRRHLVVSSMSEDPSDYLTRMVMDQNVDGLLIHDSFDPDLLFRMSEIMPTVLVNNTVDGGRIPSIMPDETSGLRQALDHLRALGHARVMFFDIADSLFPNKHHVARSEAFKRLAMDGPSKMAGARLVVLPGREKSLEDALYDQLTAWKAEGEMPTAILCAADTYAVAFMDAARRLGLSVPRDLSLIGTDDTIPCEYVRPKLTSIRQPFEAMGAAGVRTLLEAVNSPEKHVEKVTMLFDVKLIVRESCAKVLKNS